MLVGLAGLARQEGQLAAAELDGMDDSVSLLVLVFKQALGKGTREGLGYWG